MNKINILSKAAANHYNLFWNGGTTYYNYANRNITFDSSNPDADAFTEQLWNKGTGSDYTTSKEGLADFTKSSNLLISGDLKKIQNPLLGGDSSMNKAASKLGIAGAIAGAVVGGVDAAFGQVNDVKAAKKLYLHGINTFLNLTLNTSNNASLASSITNLQRMNNIKKSNLLSSKDLFALQLIGRPLGTVIGRMIANRRAKKYVKLLNTELNKANQLVQNRINTAVLQANYLNSLNSALNIIAFGGPLDNLDTANPLGYSLISDWVGILQDKSKPKIQYDNNLINLQFDKGGDLELGEEIDLTPELIKYYKSLGYEFE